MRNLSWVAGSRPRSARYPRALAPARDASVASKNFAASSITSCRVRRRCSCASASADILGNARPALAAVRGGGATPLRVAPRRHLGPRDPRHGGEPLDRLGKRHALGVHHEAKNVAVLAGRKVVVETLLVIN